MIETFVDTSFLIAVLIHDDALHERAMAWRKRIPVTWVTTEYVLVEFADALALGVLRRWATETVSVLRSDPAVRIVPASTTLLDEGLAMFAGHADKRWSLTDCISFVVMRRGGVPEALTSDHHFEQAGFRALLHTTPPEAAR